MSAPSVSFVGRELSGVFGFSRLIMLAILPEAFTFVAGLNVRYECNGIQNIGAAKTNDLGRWDFPLLENGRRCSSVPSGVHLHITYIIRCGVRGSLTVMRAHDVQDVMRPNP